VRNTCWLLLLISFNALGTSITIADSMILSPFEGMHACLYTGVAAAQCTSEAASTYATAQSNAENGLVSATVSGGAFGLATMASARASAYYSQDFLFTQGSGNGVLQYVVELSGSNGTDVLFNGNLYQMQPNGRPVVHEFTRTFTYGQPFSISLFLDLYRSWLGYYGESGSVSALAQLTSVEVLGGSSKRLTAAAIAPVPEPSTAVLWATALVLIFVGCMHRRRPQR
jgi:hypothetical protein